MTYDDSWIKKIDELRDFYQLKRLKIEIIEVDPDLYQIIHNELLTILGERRLGFMPPVRAINDGYRKEIMFKDIRIKCNPWGRGGMLILSQEAV